MKRSIYFSNSNQFFSPNAYPKQIGSLKLRVGRPTQYWEEQPKPLATPAQLASFFGMARYAKQPSKRATTTIVFDPWLNLTLTLTFINDQNSENQD